MKEKDDERGSKMKRQIFSVVTQAETQWIEVAPERIIAVGYGGRNQEKVKAKLAESAKNGKKVPSKTPINYPCGTHTLITDDKIQVIGNNTKGEAEFVLVLHAGSLYVGVGSDHTDSDLSSVSTNKAKQACGKPMGLTLWPYEEVKGHWDQLELKSWQEKDGVRSLYQEGTLQQILPVEDILLVVREDYPQLESAIIFGGTVSVVGEKISGTWFRSELFDPVLKRTLSHEYWIEILADGRE